MQTFHILGTYLTFRTNRECSALSTCFLTSGITNTGLYVSSRMLLAASHDETRRQYIESMDMTLFSEGEILRIAHIHNKNHIADVENLRFLREFLRKVTHRNLSVFLLSETPDTLADLIRLTGDYCPSLTIAGTLCLDSVSNHPENLSNHINAVTPAVILSNIASPLQEQLILSMKSYLNAEIWLGLSDNIKSRKPPHFQFLQGVYHLFLKKNSKQSVSAK